MPKSRASSYRRWTREAVLAAIRKWAEIYKEPPRQSDWDPAACRMYAENNFRLARAWVARAVEYETSDEWPPARHVADLFGTWNEAINQAGLQPRAQGQRTARGVTPSPRMAILGHVISAVYEKEYSGDEAGLKAALQRLARVALELADDLTDDELTELAASVILDDEA